MSQYWQLIVPPVTQAYGQCEWVVYELEKITEPSKLQLFKYHIQLQNDQEVDVQSEHWFSPLRIPSLDVFDQKWSACHWEIVVDEDGDAALFA